jgi:dTDP-glucose pyrophosphorylase
MKAWQKALLPVTATVQEAICNLNESSLQIVLVVDAAGVFQGSITDGDIRRGLLRSLGLDSGIESIIHRNAFVVTPEMSREMALDLMRANKLLQLPVVNADRQVVGLYTWANAEVAPTLTNLMVIFAGGRGTRMRPHTEECPKPMLHVAGKPMLEHIIERAKAEGFQHFAIAIHYLGHMIEDYFGDGSRWQVKIDYLREETPLGTAGAMGLLSPCPGEPFMVTNGDVLTDIRYSELLDYHCRHGAAATMAVRLHEWQHPYGVVKTRGLDIVGFEEKPIARSHINAGIYVLEPAALDYLGADEPCDMPTLFEKLQDADKRTIVYPMHEPWLDVGRPADYHKAEQTISAI